MSGRSRRPAQPKLRAVRQPSLWTRAAAVLPFVVPALIVVAAGLWFGGVRSGGGNEGGLPPATKAQPAAPGDDLPSFVTSGGKRVIAAYEYAVAAADQLVYIPCYCGCGEHSGHRSVRDCFVTTLDARGVEYDEHGAGCDICVSIVLDVQRLLAEGRTLAEARAFIDETYSDIGSPTNTPPPPEGW